MPIPRIIHQVWFQFTATSASIPPPEYTLMRQSWIEKHPSYEFKLWNNKEARDFLCEFYPEAVENYDGYKEEICRVDAIRYFLLDHYGGFYTDMDTECIQAIDSLLPYDVVLVKDVIPLLGLNNGFMGSVSNHPLMKSCCINLSKTSRLPHVMLQTGPLYLSGNYYLHLKDKSGVHILKVEEIKLFFNHYHHATWTPIAKWTQALNKDRRKHMTLEEVPPLLRLFIRSGLKDKE